MAWDTDGTRRRLLDAGSTHFAARGFAGARVDAIARDAGVNKERIYQYFGDKLGLFSAVLAIEVEGLMAGLEVDGRGSDAVGRLAGALYDRSAAQPQLARLLAWESLELDAPVASAARAAGCAALVSALASALDGDRDRAAQLLLTLVAMATADGCLPHLSRLIAPASTPPARRAAVIAQARALA